MHGPLERWQQPANLERLTVILSKNYKQILADGIFRSEYLLPWFAENDSIHIARDPAVPFRGKENISRMTGLRNGYSRGIHCQNFLRQHSGPLYGTLYQYWRSHL